MKIRWSKRAIEDLTAIRRYIAADNPRAAQQLARAIAVGAENLSAHPQIGRPSHVPNVRELIVPGLPYLIAYRVREDTIEIIAILHGARDRTNVSL